MANLSASINQEKSDETLIQQFKDGDQEAFTILYHRHITNVYKRVKYIIPEAEVEDVTQEVFIAMLKSLGGFKGQSKFKTWIWTITNRKIANYYRSHKVGTTELDNYEELVMRSKLSNHTESADHQQDDLVAIQHAFGKLPQNYQDILLMRFVDEMPFNEIAQKNRQSLEATKSLFRRSMAALTKKMEGDNG